MRAGILAVIVACWASASVAQEALNIPFAPPVPGRFVIEEVRTRSFEQDGRQQNRSGRVRSTLEVRSGDGPYQAVWTTISADPAAIVIDNGGSDPTLLIGRPISLTLDETGAASAFADWGGVRRGMFRIMLEHERDPFWRSAYEATQRMMEGWSSEDAARTLMETLNILSSCQDRALVPQRAEAMDVEIPTALGGAPVATRVTWELQELNEAAGTARVRHSRTPGIASANASAVASDNGLVRPKDAAGDLIQEASQSIICDVDLQTGVVRNATFEVHMRLGDESETRRREITVTPQ